MTAIMSTCLNVERYLPNQISGKDQTDTTGMADGARNARIILSPNDVIAPALKVMRTTCEIVAISLAAPENTDIENPPDIPGALHQWEFDGPLESKEQIKAAYANWLLNKGFQDIARGVRESLEGAFLYIGLFKTFPGKTTKGKIEAIRKRANKMNFSTLLASINKELKDGLSFEEEFLSLQKVRNCLEHRDGIVTADDVNHQNKLLRLILPRLRIFSEKDGDEIELKPNMRVEKGQLIEIKRVSRERIYKIGERIVFDAAEFHEIASACWFLSNDIAEKLPRATAEVDTSK